MTTNPEINPDFDAIVICSKDIDPSIPAWLLEELDNVETTCTRCGTGLIISKRTREMDIEGTVYPFCFSCGVKEVPYEQVQTLGADMEMLKRAFGEEAVAKMEELTSMPLAEIRDPDE